MSSQIRTHTVLIAGIMLAIVASCTEETNIYDSYENGPTRVTGAAHIWLCDIPDSLNNNLSNSNLFADKTEGDSARITFTQLNGKQFTLYTNDTSYFEVILDKGPYSITIESRWSLPITIANVYFDGDTTVELNTVFAFTDPDDLIISFRYAPGDTLGADWEWRQIRLMNENVNGKLKINSILLPDSVLAERTVRTYSFATYSEWILRVYTPQSHLSDVARSVNLIARNLSNDTVNISAYPRGIYPCPADEI